MPQARDQVDVAARRRMHHRDLLLGLLAHRVLGDHLLGLLAVGLGRDAVGLVGQVLFSVDVPVRHHEEHHQAPDEGDRDPGALDAVQRLLPPDPVLGGSIRLMAAHRLAVLGLACAGYLAIGMLHDLHHAPDDVDHGRHGDADEQQQERVVEQLLHRRDRLVLGKVSRAFRGSRSFGSPGESGSSQSSAPWPQRSSTSVSSRDPARGRARAGGSLRPAGTARPPATARPAAEADGGRISWNACSPRRVGARLELFQGKCRGPGGP